MTFLVTCEVRNLWSRKSYCVCLIVEVNLFVYDSLVLNMQDEYGRRISTLFEAYHKKASLYWGYGFKSEKHFKLVIHILTAYLDCNFLVCGICVFIVKFIIK